LRKGYKIILINSAEEVQASWLLGVKVIAMTAGAPTPESIVRACIETLKRMGVEQVEEVVYTEENVFFQLPKQILVG
jgi:4-hydroxy-3-methylbut-2-enyl diphosphate reductase